MRFAVPRFFCHPRSGQHVTIAAKADDEVFFGSTNFALSESLGLCDKSLRIPKKPWVGKI